MKKDEAQALKAQRDFERIKPLYAQNAASQLDLDNAEAAYESAVATVAMSEADLAQAELELGYTLVRSPLSGHISERNVDLGTLVGPGGKSLLATIVKSDTVLVDFNMTALDYLKMEPKRWLMPWLTIRWDLSRSRASSWMNRLRSAGPIIIASWNIRDSGISSIIIMIIRLSSTRTARCESTL